MNDPKDVGVMIAITKCLAIAAIFFFFFFKSSRGSSGELPQEPKQPLTQPEPPAIPTDDPWTQEAEDGLASPAYGLTIAIRRGESPPGSGVAVKTYELSRPIADVRTFDGNNNAMMQLSPDGRFCCFSSHSLFWLLDLKKEQMLCHMEVNGNSTTFDTANCRGRTIELYENDESAYPPGRGDKIYWFQIDTRGVVTATAY